MTRHTGAMDADAMIAFCRENGIKCIVDAAHPFAVGLHEAVAQTSADTGIPVVRLERTYPPRIVADNVVWCDDFDDALVRLESEGIEVMLQNVNLTDPAVGLGEYACAYMSLIYRSLCA